MKALILGSLIFLCSCNMTVGQSFWFGPKVGVSICNQRVNRSNLHWMVGTHAGLFIETYDEEETGSLRASLGYHQRGSSRIQLLNNINNVFNQSNRYLLHNLALAFDAKRIYRKNYYYTLGIRGEYNLSTNYGDFSSIYTPLDDYVRKVTGGISVGGGIQWNIGDLYGCFFEVSYHPDLFNQYVAPQIDGIVIPNTNRNTTLPEQKIRNMTLEITFGIRLLRKVEYY